MVEKKSLSLGSTATIYTLIQKLVFSDAGCYNTRKTTTMRFNKTVERICLYDTDEDHIPKRRK
jgi:hypothetical protein